MEKKYFAESELIINEDGSIFHLHVKPEQLADKVILVGDPGRVDLVASHFDTKECAVESREFRTVTGTYKGKRITVISTGIGCDNIDIVMNEVDALNFYAGRNAVCDLQMERALLNHLGWSGNMCQPAPYAIAADKELVERIAADDMVRGITVACGGFFGPQGRELRIPLTDPNQNEKLENFEYNGKHITNFEMESSALAGLARLMGHKATTVCMVIANRRIKKADTGYKSHIDDLIKEVLERL